DVGQPAQRRLTRWHSEVMATPTRARRSGDARGAQSGVVAGRPAAPSAGPGRRRPVLSRVPGFLASLFTVVAAFCVLLALIPLLRHRTEPIRAASEFLA